MLTVNFAHHPPDGELSVPAAVAHVMGGHTCALVGSSCATVWVSRPRLPPSSTNISCGLWGVFSHDLQTVVGNNWLSSKQFARWAITITQGLRCSMYAVLVFFLVPQALLHRMVGTRANQNCFLKRGQQDTCAKIARCTDLLPHTHC